MNPRINLHPVRHHRITLKGVFNLFDEREKICVRPVTPRFEPLQSARAVKVISKADQHAYGQGRAKDDGREMFHSIATVGAPSLFSSRIPLAIFRPTSGDEIKSPDGVR